MPMMSKATYVELKHALKAQKQVTKIATDRFLPIGKTSPPKVFGELENLLFLPKQFLVKNTKTRIGLIVFHEMQPDFIYLLHKNYGLRHKLSGYLLWRNYYDYRIRDIADINSYCSVFGRMVDSKLLVCACSARDLPD